jgi:predicted RNA binding protein YcfA (HicA-like mRNA interferase family)
MPKLRDFSGKEVLSFFESHDFSIISQHGSHIKLRRVVGGNKQTLIIPNHSSIHKGTFVKFLIKQFTTYQKRIFVHFSILSKKITTPGYWKAP